MLVVGGYAGFFRIRKQTREAVET